MTSLKVSPEFYENVVGDDEVIRNNRNDDDGCDRESEAVCQRVK